MFTFLGLLDRETTLILLKCLIEVITRHIYLFINISNKILSFFKIMHKPPEYFYFISFDKKN